MYQSSRKPRSTVDSQQPTANSQQHADHQTPTYIRVMAPHPTSHLPPCTSPPAHRRSRPLRRTSKAQPVKRGPAPAPVGEPHAHAPRPRSGGNCDPISPSPLLFSRAGGVLCRAFFLKRA
ncbi:hypothetical protein PYCCODRAFT_1437864 [Trametes coccinea BRFM310]|uniref:Uncharacterized protein n=1 Tax=Trametes coccinea (strain BRFM310) TaxID=1353009 RepID=A0A1Y2IIZ6_TRAC3|nr:hypothetical protein PYCCODRAFT_1437864 [Trametes coccinea BRFM310]